MTLGLAIVPLFFRQPYSVRLRLNCLRNPAGDVVELDETEASQAAHRDLLELLTSDDTGPMEVVCVGAPQRKVYVSECANV